MYTQSGDIRLSDTGTESRVINDSNCGALRAIKWMFRITKNTNEKLIMDLYPFAYLLTD